MQEALWSMDWGSIFMPTHSLLEMIVRATIMYFVIVLLLKTVVKRQTGGIGPTDILVIVLIAEIAGPGFTADYTSLAEGTVLVATVLFWSFAIEWLTHRYPAFARFFQPAPLLLIKNGRVLPRNMRTELITKDELMTHLREEGVSSIEEVEQACMEPDGMISVIKMDEGRRPSAAG